MEIYIDAQLFQRYFTIFRDYGHTHKIFENDIILLFVPHEMHCNQNKSIFISENNENCESQWGFMLHLLENSGQMMNFWNGHGHILFEIQIHEIQYHDVKRNTVVNFIVFVAEY